MFFVIFTAFLLVGVAADLPNPGCRYYGYRKHDRYLSCERNNLTFPDTFDVDLVPESVQSIILSCPTKKTRRAYCNVINNNTLTLPFLESLNDVVLFGFTGQNDRRVPLGRFLAHNKHNITRLLFRYSRIGFIDRDYFAGFGKLQDLDIGSNDISTVSVDAFASLTDETPGPPALKWLDLQENALEGFAWKILYPLRDSLIKLDLTFQSPKLHSLTLSGDAFRTAIQVLRIKGSRLQTVHHWTLDSIGLNASVHSDFDFRYNRFCEDFVECSCCEMASFMFWAKKITARNATVQFTCGKQEFVRGQSFGQQISSVSAFFNHCNASVAVTSTTNAE